MSETKELLRRGVGDFEPTPDAFDRVLARRERKQRNQRVAAGVLGIAVFALAAIGLVRLLGSETQPAVDPDSPLLGTWISTSDADGGIQRMTVSASPNGAVAIVVTDDVATVCSGTPSTMTGTGRIEDSNALVIPAPLLTCDDGSEPEAPSGPPLQEQLRDLTFVHHSSTDTLTVGFESLWRRSGGPDPSPPRTISASAWPQTTLEEAQAAQTLADAGDPDYTWQLDYGRHLYSRFLREQLGWEEFLRIEGADPQRVYVRCAPGRSNPLYPNDPEGGGCAPTIDGFRYETVRITLGQPVRRGGGGIWVVTAWATLQPSNAPITEIGDLFRHQIEQVAPPSDAEATDLLEAFLQARVDGEGAERYLHPQAEVVADCSVHSAASCSEIPLLYSTTSGAPYDWFELELVDGPVWPGGWTEFEVRLFADGGGTVVEQSFILVRGADGRLGLVPGTLDGFVETTENGETLGQPWELLGGEVTFAAARPWYEFFDFGPGTMALVHADIHGQIAVLADPLPVESGCRPGPAAADAEALAASIRSDPDFEATEPVGVVFEGSSALRMDVVTANGASVCPYMGPPLVLREPSGEARPMGPSLDQGSRMRLYLLDLPDGMSARILAIAITAPEAGFETVLEATDPIVDSFEFHPR